VKKYLILVIGIIAIITMGNAVAITLNARNLAVNKITPTIGTLGGGCGGHNNTTMTEITGILVLYNNTKFKIDDITLNLGGYCYINSTTSPYDFDGDGIIETILNELLGLAGSSITVKGHLFCQNTHLIVFYINGILYRECCGLKPSSQ
jgi:hypothetical protein